MKHLIGARAPMRVPENTNGAEATPRANGSRSGYRLASSVLDRLSILIARTEAMVGWGNVIDVIAVAC